MCKLDLTNVCYLHPLIAPTFTLLFLLCALPSFNAHTYNNYIWQNHGELLHCTYIAQCEAKVMCGNIQ